MMIWISSVNASESRNPAFKMPSVVALWSALARHQYGSANNGLVNV
jgi:hypothetical protein